MPPIETTARGPATNHGRRGRIRNLVPVVLVAAALVAMSIALAAAAASIAVARPARANLDTDLASRLSANYSAGAESDTFAPLDPQIVEIARNDQRGLDSNPEAEIVDVYYFDPPDPNDHSGDGDIFVNAPPIPEPEDRPTSSPRGTPGDATKTPTPAPGATPRPTPTGGTTPTTNVTPPPTAVATATPTPSPTPVPTPQPTTVSIVSMADSHVNQLLPNSNFGSAPTMSVDSSARSLVLFDLSVIPIGSDVLSARVALCALTVTAGAGGRTQQINQVSSLWTESGVTWNNQPGGNSGSAMPFTLPATAGCFSVDVTPALQALAQGGPNYGMRITDQDEGTALLVQYATREDPLPGRRPTLIVTFHAP